MPTYCDLRPPLVIVEVQRFEQLDERVLKWPDEEGAFSAGTVSIISLPAINAGYVSMLLKAKFKNPQSVLVRASTET